VKKRGKSGILVYLKEPHPSCQSLSDVSGRRRAKLQAKRGEGQISAPDRGSGKGSQSSLKKGELTRGSAEGEDSVYVVRGLKIFAIVLARTADRAGIHKGRKGL